MKARQIAGVTLCLLAAGHACSVKAQARGESAQDIQKRNYVEPEIAHARQMTALDAWLRRLPGRYRSPDGWTEVECTSTGAGPGVLCVSRYSNPVLVPQAPDFTLYGLDPDLPGIRKLRVSGQSIADHDEAGRLKGNTLVFQSPCPLPVRSPSLQRQPTPVRCWHQTRVFAPPNSDSVLLLDTRDMTVIMPPSAPTRIPLGDSDRIKTATSYQSSEWRRVHEGEVGEPMLQLGSVEPELLEQHGNAQFTEFVGHVADLANKIPPSLRVDLESQLTAYEANTSQTIIIVTVPALGGQTIATFSRRAVETLRLGKDEHTNYIVVAVAPNEGAARIETGAAMRACVPDAMAKQILEEVMVPELRRRRIGEGMQQGVAQLMAVCAELLDDAVKQVEPFNSDSPPH